MAGKDSIEVMTLESQQKLMEEREAIRKKLFESGNDDNNNNISNYYDDENEADDQSQFSVYGSSLHTPPRNRPLQSTLLKRSATDASQEVLPNGRVLDTISEKYKSDRFSLPIQQVSRSWDTGSLLRIAEDPVDYGRKSRSTGPVSVDMSYTESELASVISKRQESTQAEIELKPTESSLSVPGASITTSVIPESPDTAAMIRNTPESNNKDSSSVAATTPDSNVKDSSSAAATASTGAVVSPANTSRSSIIPMDEKLDELEIQRALNTGKSPLRGMPDDEQHEYQKDEMEALPISPLRDFGLGLIQKISSFRLAQESVTDGANGEVKTTTEMGTFDDRSAVEMKDSTLSNPPSDNNGSPTQQFSCSSVPEFGRSIVQKVSDCSTGVAQQFTFSSASESGRSIMQKVSECSSGALSNTMLKTTDENRVGTDAAETTITGGKMSVDETASLTTNNTLRNRPVYLDETSALRFLRRITNNGFVLLYLQPPEDLSDPDENSSSIDDWKGRTVTIMIQKGHLSTNTTRGYVNQHQNEHTAQNRSPKLEWTTVTGGIVTEATTTSIDLLNIQSISTNDDDDIGDEDDLCFFTITSEDGDIHVFETATVEERDRIVNGLKTLIARWSYHVIAGEVTATSELFETSSSSSPERNVNQSDDDLPSLPNPHLTMNCVAHMMLDSVI